MSDNNFLKFLGVIFVFLLAIGAIARGISGWQQKQSCARKGYPRTVDAGNLWPVIKCVRLVNGTEEVHGQ